MGLWIQDLCTESMISPAGEQGMPGVGSHNLLRSHHAPHMSPRESTGNI